MIKVCVKSFFLYWILLSITCQEPIPADNVRHKQQSYPSDNALSPLRIYRTRNLLTQFLLSITNTKIELKFFYNILVKAYIATGFLKDLTWSSRFWTFVWLTILTECVANSTNFEMLLGYFNLTAHSMCFTSIFAVWMRIPSFEKYLILFTFSGVRQKMNKGNY